MKPVSLQAVVDEMDFLSDTVTAYINRKKGDLFSVSDEDERLIEYRDEEDDFIPDWQKEMLPKIREVLESDDYIALPDQFDIHEYSIMERFCLSLQDDGLRDELLHAIQGSGAFRRFKDRVHHKGLQDDWYSYRNDALKRIAADFLEAEGIPFIDDNGGS